MTWDSTAAANLDLEGKVAIVCGAGAPGDGLGNGRAAALLLAHHGCRVVCVDREQDLAEATADMIARQDGEALAVGADVTSEEDCKRVLEETVDQFGGVDLLDNNVGIGSRGSIIDDSPSSWQRIMRINVDSIYWMSRLVIPAMRERGGGAIVNLSSISALRPRGLTAYSTSKGAVIAMTKAMAVDHAADGIRVNCVAPGPVFTPRIEAGGIGEEGRQKRIEASPLNIEGTGWDVGNAVVFLLSGAARYITGQTLVVDGGVTLRGPER